MAYKCDECGKTSEEKEDCCGAEMKKDESEKEEDFEDFEKEDL
jgi:DNA-directed RNA polymerase subunit RPC12/RpoP